MTEKKKKHPDVTLFADASWQPKTGACGWGMWARTPEQRVLASGKFAECLPSSTLAELGAVVNGIALLDAIDWLEEGKVVLIKTDCMAVVKQLLDGAPAIHRVGADMLAAFEDMKQKTGFHFWIKHVKGHQGGGTPRSYVNEVCDKLAREASTMGTFGKLHVKPKYKDMQND